MSKLFLVTMANDLLPVKKTFKDIDKAIVFILGWKEKSIKELTKRKKELDKIITRKEAQLVRSKGQTRTEEQMQQMKKSMDELLCEYKTVRSSIALLDNEHGNPAAWIQGNINCYKIEGRGIDVYERIFCMGENNY